MPPSPSYLALSDADWRERIAAAMALLSPCRLCPRECGAERSKGKRGVCRAGAVAEVSSHNAHHGEEPPLSGTGGSGTIFLTHCPLRCVFCQNFPISHLGNGKPAPAPELAAMMVKLQARGCHNINFVTPTHMMPFIVEALPLAAQQGFRLPLVWNCSGYESLDALRVLDGIVDIYLPDLKYDRDDCAKKITNAPDFVRHNRAAVLEMYRQVGDLQTDEEGIATRGLIIRHLVLPNGLSGSPKALRWIKENISPHTAISLMSQYFPAHQAFEVPEVSRRINASEYYEAVDAMEELGLEEGWIQEEPLDD